MWFVLRNASYWLGLYIPLQLQTTQHIHQEYRCTWLMYVCECVCTLSRVWFFVTSWIVAHHGTVTLLCPWHFSGKNIGVCCHFLLQGIFLTRGSNPCLWHLLHWQADSLPLWYLGTPIKPIPHSVRVVWWRGKTILHSCRLFSWLSHPSRAYNISCQKLVTFWTYIFKARV